MPLVKPQHLKSLKTISLQPEKYTNRIEVILYMDLAGRKARDIAEEVGLTESRVSIIRNSPLYLERIGEERDKLRERYRESQTERVTSGDPVEEALKGAALEAANKKIELMREGKSEFVRLAASGDVLDRAGYKAHQEKTKLTIEVTEKMSERFEKALMYEHTSE